MRVKINNIIIILVIKSELTWWVDSAPDQPWVDSAPDQPWVWTGPSLKRIKKGLTWPDPVKNLGRSGIKHWSKTRWLFFEIFLGQNEVAYILLYIYIYMIFFRSTHVDPPDTWLRSYHRSTLKLSFKIIIIIIFIYTLTWINMSLPFRSTIRALPWIGPWFKF